MIFNAATVIHWIYKGLLLFFIAIFVRNLFSRKTSIQDQILYSFVLFPFVLRMLSIK